VTSMFVRCSAWFGSVRFGFLAPEIFIRAGSAQLAFTSLALISIGMSEK
jgi:hypothetical protein